LSAGSLAAVVLQHGASAGVPTSLISSTVKAATILAAGQATVAGVVPARVAALTEGVMKSIMLTKLKCLMAVMLAVTAMASLGAGFVGYGTAGGQSANRKSGTVAPKADAKAQARNDMEAEKDDKEKLQGTWQVVALETQGLRLEEGRQEIKGLKMRISGNRITFIYPGREEHDSFDFRVQSSDTPKGIEFWNEKKGKANAYRGIYQVDEDDLKIHFVKDGEARPPTNFTPALGRNRWLYTLRREQSSSDRQRSTGLPLKARGPALKSEVRLAVPPEQYSAIYDRTLGALSDHFKIDHSNRFEGRIDTCPAFVDFAPAAGGEREPFLRRRAVARITPLAEGGFSVELIVPRERRVVPPSSRFAAAVEWEAAGRDYECERALLSHIEKGVAVDPDRSGPTNPKSLPSEPSLPRPLQPVGPTIVTTRTPGS
jgi:uncharacterized protein (TIGR03067 family)